MYKIIDTTNRFATMAVPDRSDIIEFVRPMFEPGRSLEVDSALNMLELAIARELPTGELEAFLGITIL